MDQAALQKILDDHRLWLENKGGKTADLREANLCRADLHGADLCEANLCGADLRVADLRGADLGRADLREANLGGADLGRADLREADLREANLGGADLREANLCGANLDFSVLPLQCGGLRWKIDARIAAQIAYHFCSMKCDDPDFIRVRNNMLDFANRFHRVDECGRLLPIQEQQEAAE
jgi:hypothetical protein